MLTSRPLISTRVRLPVIAVIFITSLTLIDLEITTKHRIITEGTTILLEFAPRDPRSLLQGDYMALRYAMADEVAQAAEAAGVSDGLIVVQLDENAVARFSAIHSGEPLANDQHLLQFRKRGESVRLASDAFFFEEGTGSQYRDARYGELRVSKASAAMLSGLRSAVHDSSARFLVVSQPCCSHTRLHRRCRRPNRTRKRLNTQASNPGSRERHCTSAARERGLVEGFDFLLAPRLRTPGGSARRSPPPQSRNPYSYRHCNRNGISMT